MSAGGVVSFNPNEMSKWSWGRLGRWCSIFLVGALVARGGDILALAERRIAGDPLPARIVVEKTVLEDLDKRLEEHLAWAEKEVSSKNSELAELRLGQEKLLRASEIRDQQFSDLRQLIESLSAKVEKTREDVAYIRGRIASQQSQQDP